MIEVIRGDPFFDRSLGVGVVVLPSGFRQLSAPG
jgi:hypothetical protein